MGPPQTLGGGSGSVPTGRGALRRRTGAVPAFRASSSAARPPPRAGAAGGDPRQRGVRGMRGSLRCGSRRPEAGGGPGAAAPGAPVWGGSLRCGSRWPRGWGGSSLAVPPPAIRCGGGEGAPPGVKRVSDAAAPGAGGSRCPGGGCGGPGAAARGAPVSGGGSRCLGTGRAEPPAAAPGAPVWGGPFAAARSAPERSAGVPALRLAVPPPGGGGCGNLGRGGGAEKPGARSAHPGAPGPDHP